ncbi:MAG: ATP synthase F1 subunit delta [Saprospiraceae bacterium]
MSVSKIAGRYAKSLLDLSQEKGLIDAINNDMQEVSNACQNKDLLLFIKNPIINTDKKLKVFKAIFTDKINPLTQSFLEILIQKGRESIIPQICTSFVDQYKSLNKIRPAKLISATIMGESEVNLIKNKFKSWLKNGETMELIQVVDPSIIGGYIFQMDGQQVDATVKKNLDSMKTGLHDKSYTNLVIKS